MRIPKSLQYFTEPSLIVVCGTETAKFHLAGGDAIEEIDGIELPRATQANKEACLISGTHFGAPTTETREEARKKKFVSLISARIAGLIRGGHAKKIYISAPASIDRPLEAKLPRDLRNRVVGRIPKDLLHAKMVEILERFRGR